jgi:hypothetical protein
VFIVMPDGRPLFFSPPEFATDAMLLHACKELIDQAVQDAVN